MKTNNTNFSAIDIQNAFKYVNFIIQENSTVNKWTIVDVKKYKSQILALLEWSKIIGQGYTSQKPKKIEKLLNLYCDKKYKVLEEAILSLNRTKLSKKQLQLSCKEFINVLKDYLRIIKKVWLQGEGRMFAKFDQKYYESVLKEFNKFKK